MTNWQFALDRVLQSWRGTPWGDGQACRGPQGGVNCVNFVVAVLDQLHGYKLPPISGVPRDLGFHDRAAAIRVARQIARRYPNVEMVCDAAIEPGDVLVIRLGEAGGPGHLLIAGCNAGELWHSGFNVGVVRTSVAAVGRTKIVMHWRPTEKETWKA